MAGYYRVSWIPSNNTYLYISRWSHQTNLVPWRPEGRQSVWPWLCYGTSSPPEVDHCTARPLLTTTSPTTQLLVQQFVQTNTAKLLFTCAFWRWSVDSSHKGPVHIMRKAFLCHAVTVHFLHTRGIHHTHCLHELKLLMKTLRLPWMDAIR